MDSFDLYDCQLGGPSPFLIDVNLGTPYAKSYWKVKDASEQNGLYKILLGEAKKELVDFKIKHGLPIYLRSEDIVPLVNKYVIRKHKDK